MPHLVIEYSRALEPQVSLPGLLQAAHGAALASGQFDVADIKVRAYPCDHALVAGVEADFVHVLIYLLSGRDDVVKKALAEAVLAAAADILPPIASISVDVRDMNRAIYSKRTDMK